MSLTTALPGHEQEFRTTEHLEMVRSLDSKGYSWKTIYKWVISQVYLPQVTVRVNAYQAAMSCSAAFSAEKTQGTNHDIP